MNRPSAVPPPRAVILDYGNVLTLPQAEDVIESMARRLGVAVPVFTAAYWQHRRPYDAGDYTGAQYWRNVLGSLGRPEQPDERTLVAWLTGRDGDSWMRFRDEVWDLTRRLRHAPVRTAILSNMTVDLAASIRQRRRLEDWFDAVVVSAEVRVAKPDARIYRLCLDRIGVGAADALFVDDRPENVQAAAALGLRTVHFVGEGALAALRSALGTFDAVNG